MDQPDNAATWGTSLSLGLGGDPAAPHQQQDPLPEAEHEQAAHQQGLQLEQAQQPLPQPAPAPVLLCFGGLRFYDRSCVHVGCTLPRLVQEYCSVSHRDNATAVADLTPEAAAAFRYIGTFKEPRTDDKEMDLICIPSVYYKKTSNINVGIPTLNDSVFTSPPWNLPAIFNLDEQPCSWLFYANHSSLTMTDRIYHWNQNRTTRYTCAGFEDQPAISRTHYNLSPVEISVATAEQKQLAQGWNFNLYKCGDVSLYCMGHTVVDEQAVVRRVTKVEVGDDSKPSSKPSTTVSNKRVSNTQTAGGNKKQSTAASASKGKEVC